MFKLSIDEFFSKATVLGVILTGLMLMMTAFIAPEAKAADRQEINREVQETLAHFKTKVNGGSSALAKAKGVLVFPDVYKVGFGFGGEFGEGALLVNGGTADYYNMASASWGFQLGAQKKSVILLFMEPQALSNFRESQGWEVGAGASLAVIAIGAEETVSSDRLNKPIIAFVTDQKGLMYDLSLEGTKFTKIKK